MQKHTDIAALPSTPDTVSFRRPAGFGHLPALDGLRGTAILLVMLTHFLNFYPSSTRLPLKVFRLSFELGSSGVDLFFVLSGFLITGILLDARGKPARQYFRDFYIRRVLRIFPLYYGFLIVLLFLTALPKLAHVRGELAWYFAYLQNWRWAVGAIWPPIGHFWSLAIEEQFYLAWPLIVYNSRSMARTSLFALAACQIVRLGLVLGGAPATFFYASSFTRIDGVLLGSFLAVALRDARLSRIVQRYNLALGACSLLLLLVSMKLSGTLDVVGRVTPFVIFGSVAFSGLYASLLWRIVYSNKGGIFNWSALRLNGKYSYAMYVFHIPVMFAVTAPWFRRNIADYTRLTGGSGWTVWAGASVVVLCCILLTFAAGMLSWWLLESRALALRDRWTSQSKPRTPPREPLLDQAAAVAASNSGINA